MKFDLLQGEQTCEVEDGDIYRRLEPGEASVGAVRGRRVFILR